MLHKMLRKQFRKTLTQRGFTVRSKLRTVTFAPSTKLMIMNEVNQVRCSDCLLILRQKQGSSDLKSVLDQGRCNRNYTLHYPLTAFSTIIRLKIERIPGKICIQVRV